MRILVVEGDPKVLHPLQDRLRAGAWAVDGVDTAQEARERLGDVRYDLVVVGRALPDDDGLTLVEDIPEETGLVVMGWKGGTEERLWVLDQGADDCVDPPADIEEVAVRVAKVLVRRTSLAPGPVRLGRVVVDRIRRLATIDGKKVAMSSTQFCVLDHLVAARHRVVGTQELLDHCWNSERDLFSDPLSSQIHRLRATFRGVLEVRWVKRDGYLLEVVEEPPPSP